MLGSATPSMEAWNLAEEGRADLLRLPERATGGRLPAIELVDMRQEFRETKADRPLLAAPGRWRCRRRSRAASRR